MGKRSNFERVERDFYPTPKEAVLPLFPHIQENTSFVEPCAGNGALIGHLEASGMVCLLAGDIEPKREDIHNMNALTLELHGRVDYIITNPPWDRKILHPMITHFRQMKPTWLLFDADWMHTKQASEHLKYCSKIVSVGRVKWIPDSKMTGKDNCAWYKFLDHETTTEFVGR